MWDVATHASAKCLLEDIGYEGASPSRSNTFGFQAPSRAPRWTRGGGLGTFQGTAARARWRARSRASRAPLLGCFEPSLGLPARSRIGEASRAPRRHVTPRAPPPPIHPSIRSPRASSPRHGDARYKISGSISGSTGHGRPLGRFFPDWKPSARRFRVFPAPRTLKRDETTPSQHRARARDFFFFFLEILALGISCRRGLGLS